MVRYDELIFYFWFAIHMHTMLIQSTDGILIIWYHQINSIHFYVNRSRSSFEKRTLEFGSMQCMKLYGSILVFILIYVANSNNDDWETFITMVNNRNDFKFFEITQSVVRNPLKAFSQMVSKKNYCKDNCSRI